MDIKITIPNEQIMQLWSSAIEGGDPVTTASKGGWCSGIDLKAVSVTLEAVRPPFDTSAWYSKPEFFAAGVELAIEVCEVDDETTGHETTHTITPADVVRGLEVMAKEFPSWFGQILGDDVDATCADIFLQCILFGEEKYA